MSEPQPPSYSESIIPAQGTTIAAASPSQNGDGGQPPSRPQPIAVAQPQMFWQIGPDGQPQMFYGHYPSAAVQPLVQPASQALPYIPLQPAAQPVTAPLPPSLQPNSFLAFSLFVMITCAILNLTSLVLGIPALVFSMQSEEQKQTYQYESAKKSGAIALTLNVINMIYTFITVTLIIGLCLGLL